jgi:hypothetical protein
VAASQSASGRTLHVRLRARSSRASVELKQAVAVRARVEPLLQTDPARLDRLRARGEARSGRRPRDLSQWFTIEVDEAADVDAVIDELERLPQVETVLRAPEPAPPPVTPDFTPLQGYLGPAPRGVDASFAHALPGGLGENVRFADIEYSWNTQHEDLPDARAPGAVVLNGTPWDPFSSSAHGTAAVAVTAAEHNGYGVSGIAPEARLHLVNAANDEVGWALADAIIEALTVLGPGDVMLLEQQFADDGGSFVPVEWYPPFYDAIVTAVANGVIVVEAAGNGGQDLDDASEYGSPFPAGKPDSGAIIVGGGNGCSAAADRFPLGFTFGSRVDVQGWGNCVTTAGYGDLQGGADPNARYTDTFNGTSSASAVVAGVAASLSSVYEEQFGTPATPAIVRDLLVSTGTPQPMGPGLPTADIGPRPDLEAAIRAVDTQPPNVSMDAPTRSVSLSKQVAVAWSGSDELGIGRFDVQRRTARWNDPFGSWTSWKSTSATSAALTSSYGRTHCFRVRAMDNIGNTSGWSAPRCTAVPLRATQLTYSSGWSTVDKPGAFGGALRRTTTLGATASRSGVSGERLYLVATRCPSCGQLRVTWNGTTVKTIDLRAASTVRRQVVPLISWSAPHHGTLTLTTVSAGKTVAVEGLAVQRS